MVPLSPGSVFAGDYRIVQPLSSGGMGAVYVAEQLSTRKLRALKLMHGQLLADESFRRRFEQEAHIGARIPSEHVVEVQSAGVDAQTGAPYLVMELLEGENLESMVRRRGALAPAEVRVIMEQICHALGAAHQAGIVHRDLKPLNVFIAKTRRTDVAFTVKVLDFGIAKLLSERTTQTAAIGSPLWLAPEQTEKGHVTPAADVWALGLLAFYLLTGASFWNSAAVPDSSVTQVMREVLFDPIPAASARAAERGASLPSGFDTWFTWCVNRDPAARIPDAHQAFAGLAPLLPGHASLQAGASALLGASPAAYEASQFASGSGSGAIWSTGAPSFAASAPAASASQVLAPSGGSLGSPEPRPSLSGTRSGLAMGCLVAAIVAPLLGLVLGAGGYFLMHHAAPEPRVTSSQGITSPPVSESASVPSSVASSTPRVPDSSAPPATQEARARASSVALSGSPLKPPGATPTALSGGASSSTAAAPTATLPRPGRRGSARTLVNGIDTPSDCQSVLRGLEPSLRGCYERAIANDTGTHENESMILGLVIGPTGTITRIDTRIDNAPPGAGTCTLGVLRGARFSPTPKANTVSASLIVSFSIVQ